MLEGEPSPALYLIAMLHVPYVTTMLCNPGDTPEKTTPPLVEVVCVVLPSNLTVAPLRLKSIRYHEFARTMTSGFGRAAR